MILCSVNLSLGTEARVVLSQVFEDTDRKKVHNESTEVQTAENSEKSTSVFEVFNEMELLDVLDRIERRLYAAQDLDQLFKTLGDELNDLTGFQHVAVYHSDNAGNFRLFEHHTTIQESQDSIKTPKTSKSRPIPIMKDLYTSSRVVSVHTPNQKIARVVYEDLRESEPFLDTTRSYLAETSEQQIQQLKDIDVTMAISIPLDAFGKRWGLIICHSTDPEPSHVSLPLRKLCQMISLSLSKNLERLTERSSLKHWDEVNDVIRSSKSFSTPLPPSNNLLKLFSSKFGMISVGDKSYTFGSIEDSQHAIILLHHLRTERITKILASHHFVDDFPTLKAFGISSHSSRISSLLHVPLSTDGTDFMVFVRTSPPKLENLVPPTADADAKQPDNPGPVAQSAKSDPSIIEPVKEWTLDEIDTAEVLRLVYTVFVYVSRQNAAAPEHSDLTKLLLSNAAHEIRTPLNAIINYLELGLEGAMDPKVRRKLRESQAAALKLVQPS